MFCGNCGSNIDDNSIICPKCGKSSKGDYIVDNQQYNYPLTNFTSKSFRLLFEIILWIILLGSIIVGSAIGGTLNYAFAGFIVGGIIGLISIVLIGGLVSLFIKIVNNTDEIKRKIK